MVCAKLQMTKNSYKQAVEIMINFPTVAAKAIYPKSVIFENPLINDISSSGGIS
jgi:hypothetical protein